MQSRNPPIVSCVRQTTSQLVTKSLVLSQHDHHTSASFVQGAQWRNTRHSAVQVLLPFPLRDQGDPDVHMRNGAVWI